MGNMIATTAGALSLPAAGEDLINVARGLQGVDIGEAMTGGKNAIARMMRKPATAAQSQAGVPGSIKQLPFLPKGMQPKIPEGLIPKGELGTPTNPGPFNRVPSRVSPSMRSDPFNPPAPFVNPGAPLPSADEFYQTRGSEMSNILKRGVNEPSEPFVNPGAPLPSSNEFYTNRGNEINSILRRGVNEPLTAYNTPPEAQSAEGVKGSVPKPSGRLVVLPQEAQALDQMQAIAEKRASQHGMQYAAGMRPAGGGRVPMTPTGITTTEFPVRPERAPMPWETQGSTASAFGPPLQTTTDTLGVRWATDGTNRVSIPKNIPPEAVESYARPKLAEQAQIRSQLPWMKGQQ
jgi:hypothetical protein